MKFVVPMLESERGWGQKIDGYAGPFDTFDQADVFRAEYNGKNNSEQRVPDYYIMALTPTPHTGQVCDYRSTVE